MQIVGSKALTLKVHLCRVPGSQMNRPATTQKFRGHSQTFHRDVNPDHSVHPLWLFLSSGAVTAECFAGSWL